MAGVRIGHLTTVASILVAILRTSVRADDQAFLIPHLQRAAINLAETEWADGGLHIDAMADVRVGHRSPLPPSPVVRIAWDDAGLLVLVRTADSTPSDGLPGVLDGDLVEILVGSLRENGKGFQLAIVPRRTPLATPPKLLWTDKRADTSQPLTAEAVSVGSNDGYTLAARLPWADFANGGKAGNEYRIQVQVEDAAPGLDRLTFGWKPTTESRWLEPTQLQLVCLADTASPPSHLAVDAEYQRYRRTQVRITDTAASENARYTVTDAKGGLLAEAAGDAAVRIGNTARLTINLPMPSNIPSDRTVTVTRRANADAASESASVVPAGPLGRGDALAAADFRFETTVFSGPAFPASDFADPLAIEDLIGPYTVTRRFFDADLNEVQSATKPGRYGALVTITGTGGLRGERRVTLFRTPQELHRRTDQVGGQMITLPDAYGISPQTQAAQPAALGRLLAAGVRNDAAHAGETASYLATLSECGPQTPRFVDRTSPGARDDHWWHTLDAKLGINRYYPYMTLQPAGYDAADNQAKTYPLLIFLHGVGQCGEDPKDLADWGPLPVLRKRADNPFLVVAPRCPYNAYWDADKLADLLTDVAAKYRVDRSRVYVTGLSMGGSGAWEFATAYPERIAAAVPICTGGDGNDMARLKDVGFWVFEGAHDPSVNIVATEAAIDQLRAFGGDARFTAYADGGHDIWDRAYQSDALYTWLLAHRRPQD